MWKGLSVYNMAGKLYGVGVGPGDPELLTLKAVKIIHACEVIAAPGKEPQKAVAYKIAHSACPEIECKEVLGIHMPMTKNEAELKKSHEAGALILENTLQQGKNVAFLTLGDPCIYSTYLYLHQRILEKGYEAELISGIPSFCAASARVNLGLLRGAEQLHVIPASYYTDGTLKLPGTKILMKAGKQLGKVKEQLKGMEAQVIMVENCGMPGERTYYGVQEMPDSAGYYTVLFVKEEEKI